MRLTISSLILTAGLATAAYAQEEASSAVPVSAPDAAPVTTVLPLVPPTPEEPPPPRPVLPTTGDVATVLSVLDRICIPVVSGQDLDLAAKAFGMKKSRRDGSWSMRLESGRRHEVKVFPLGANADVCNVELRYAIGEDAPLTSALNIWSFVHEPSLTPTANYTQPQDPDGLQRVRRSWESVTSSKLIGVNFSTVRKADGSPLNRRYSTATLQYQVRTF